MGREPGQVQTEDGQAEIPIADSPHREWEEGSRTEPELETTPSRVPWLSDSGVMTRVGLRQE